VDIRVTPKGLTLEASFRRTSANVKKANRAFVSPVTRKGIAAIKSGAPTFRGKQLTAKTDPPHLTATSATITFYGKPAGAWSIKESGTDGPYPIRPKKASVLAFPGAGRKTKGGRSGVQAYVLKHPGIAGRRAWTKARPRLERAVGPVIRREYDKALTS
jgi:hypothetical protein